MSIEEIIKTIETGMKCGEKDCCFDCENCDLDMPDGEFGQALRAVIALLRTHPDAQPNEPLTLEQLLEMDGEAVYLAADRKWYIVSLKFPGPWGNNVPCGVDMWGAGTSLSLLAKCGVYRRPPKEET